MTTSINVVESVERVMINAIVCFQLINSQPLLPSQVNSFCLGSIPMALG